MVPFPRTQLQENRPKILTPEEIAQKRNELKKKMETQKSWNLISIFLKINYS